MPNFGRRYNIAPSQDGLVVRLDQDGEQSLALLRWGLVPSWAKDRKISYRTINARAETVAEKPAFRAAFRRRRCLVPVTGYYEWQAGQDGKQPYRFVPKDGELFGFAGLWEAWQQDDERIESFTIIVTEANDLARPIHDRMPVIVAPEHYDAWLAAKDLAIPKALLEDPYPAAKMGAYPVSRRIGNPKNDDAELIAEV